MRCFGVDMGFERMIADGVDRRGIDDAAHALFPGGFVDVVAAADVGGEDRLPRRLQRRAAEMHDRIDSRRRSHHGLRIIELEGRDLLMRLRSAERDAVRKAKLARQWRKTRPQPAAQPPCRAGDQDSLVMRAHAYSLIEAEGWTADRRDAT